VFRSVLDTVFLFWTWCTEIWFDIAWKTPGTPWDRCLFY